LLKLLTEFEDLLDRTLGDWDTEPVSLKLKEGAKPYHGRPFPTPQVHQPTLMKVVERLCKLGVLKWQPESEWGSSSCTDRTKLYKFSVILGKPTNS
jgi:hypothetical protein